MSNSTIQSSTVNVAGYGLITGQPCNVLIGQPEKKDSAWAAGIVFQSGKSRFPARLSTVLACDRGVMLGSDGATVSIVEHFLAACALARVTHLHVNVEGPELPILDGSADPWLKALAPFTMDADEKPETAYCLQAPVRVQTRADIWMEAVPATVFSLTYTVDFPVAGLQNRTVRWQAGEPITFAHAGTFGLMDELPALQARGLALGVTPENTLGFTADGETSRPLRLPDEPAWHKLLDCLGDLMLMGVNPLSVGMAVTAHRAGHAIHTALAARCLPLLRPIS